MSDNSAPSLLVSYARMTRHEGAAQSLVRPLCQLMKSRRFIDCLKSHIFGKFVQIADNAATSNILLRVVKILMEVAHGP